MKINHHLTKLGPLYRVIDREITVKLLKVNSGLDGLLFTAEIVGGGDNGKWTQVNKKDLSRINGITNLKGV